MPGQREVSACLQCPAGKYCDLTGNIAPDGDCDAGYYCTAGASSAQQTASDPGYYSNAGAAIQSKCQPGTYQPTAGQSACLPCEKGYHCPGFGTINRVDCPQGSYCPDNSDRPTPCPAGTYGAAINLEEVANCTSCDGGKYCESQGLTSITGTCEAGYYCATESISLKPTLDTSTAVEANQRFGPCWTGYYCEADTTTPTPCPEGTYNDALMGKALSDCKPCLPGQYCAGTGNKAPDANCDAGYYCPGSSISATPATECAAGEYCPAGSSMATKCPAGTHSAGARASVCAACPAGSYCVAGTSAPVDCPAGFYCPENTTRSDEFPCEIGKYRNTVGASTPAECLDCPAGKVCEFAGTADETATDCDAGYYCLVGSSFTIPESSTFGRMCNPGEY